MRSLIRSWQACSLDFKVPGLSFKVVSLGGFGGYVIVGFDQAVRNNPQHRYGVDFTVSGNAFASWIEPCALMVMKDVNDNGLADDTWYELAGSGYYFSNAKKTSMNYFNPRYTTGRDVIWEIDQGKAGVLRDNIFRNQPYVYRNRWWPNIQCSGR